MNKMIATLESVNKLGLGAIIITAGLLMGFKAPENKLADVLWGNNNGTWIQLTSTSQYVCDGDQGICTRLYPEGKNPTANPNEYTSEIPGEFVQ